MKYLFSFFVFVFVFLHTHAFCSNDPFVQNMYALLEGGNRTELRYDVNQELIVTIEKKNVDQDEYFIIKFTKPEHEETEDEGAFLLAFSGTDNGSVGYLKWLHKISSGYSGTKLLEVLSEFCSQMQLKTVLLVDASEVIDEHCSCWLSLKKSHILLSNNSISWYESKGFQPISEATLTSWFGWMLKDSALPYHYFLPIPRDCYRTAAESYANLDCTRYLNALVAMDEETGLFTEQADTLRVIVEKSPISMAKELYKVRDFREDLLKVLEEPLLEDTETEFYSKMAALRSSHSADVSLAGILLFQMHLRDEYNIQLEDGRKKFLEHIVDVFHGEKFAYTPDNTFLLKVAARFGMSAEPKVEEETDIDHSLTQLGLDYLADTPLNIFPEHQSSYMTVKEAVDALAGDEQLRFLETLVFGENSSEYYDDVTAHIQKLLSSTDAKEFFFGHMLNQALLESSSIMEKQL